MPGEKLNVPSELSTLKLKKRNICSPIKEEQEKTNKDEQCFCNKNIKNHGRSLFSH